jgi:hypothetical protein
MICQTRPESLGYEVEDANTYAAWGVDYLKFDSCYTNGTPPVVEYSIMRDALNATGRPIFFSLCGMCTHINCGSTLCILFYIFLLKVVWVPEIYGHLMLEIVGEPHQIFKIIGLP